MAYDYGYNTFAAALWFAKDPQTQRTYIYREYYVSQRAASMQAADILELEQGEEIAYRIADPAIWKSTANAETGENIAQIMDKNKVHFQPANNDRLAGLNAIHESLSLAPDGLPWKQVFSSCTNYIRTIPMLPYDESKTEDVDTDAEDHLYDVDRYGTVGARPAKEKREPKQRNYDPITGRIRA